ncbi:MAG: alpha/beta hydrolase family protein [Candidatus Krumholzibacteriia bacterium]
MVQHAVHTVEIASGDNTPVRGDLYLPPSTRPRGVVVLAHGFKGYRTWAFFPYLARSIRDAGMAALAIDFSHNGRGGETGSVAAAAGLDSAASPYPRADLFARNTIRREIADLSAVIRHLGGGGLDAFLAPSPWIGLHGHSRGGVVAILNALEHREVRAVCTWSAPPDPDTFTEKQKEKWRRKGVYDFVLAEDGIPLAVGLDYLDDLERNHEAYHVALRASALRVPLLVVHGEADMVVPVERARELHAAASNVQDKRLLILKTGHTFGISYPYSQTDEIPGALAQAVVETVGWFKNRLQAEVSL